MASYLITYMDGEAEEVTADTFEPSGGQYIAYREGKPAAYVPAANVRSIHRQDEGPDTVGEIPCPVCAERQKVVYLSRSNAGEHFAKEHACFNPS